MRSAARLTSVIEILEKVEDENKNEDDINQSTNQS